MNSFYSTIPARYVFVFLSFAAISLFYAYKVVLSVAIVSMVKHSDTGNSTPASDEIECRPLNNTNSAPVKDGQFEWTSHQQAIILGAYFYGGIITQIPTGIVAEKYGAKWIFGFSVLFAAIMSLLSPVAARKSYLWFFITRFCQGLSDGVSTPAILLMISRWVPKMERTRAIAIIFCVSSVGTIITLPLTGYLCAHEFLDGWPAIFYILGIAGIIWFVCWVALFHETPNTHPYITVTELDVIRKGLAGELSNNELKQIVPWKSILTSIPVYAIIVTHFGQTWGIYTVLTLLPTYFTKILHFDIKKNGLLSSVPYILQAIVGLLSSFIADRVRQSGKISINVIRKVSNTIGFIGPAICWIAVIVVKCNESLSVTFFALSMALTGFGYSGIKSTHVDMSPDYAGSLMALTNTFASLPGFIAPIVASQFYSNGQTLANWSYVFYLSAGVYCVTALVYIFFATARLQSWGKTQVKINSIKQ